MANTGYKQAIIAYKVSKPGGEPLDVNGQLTRISGRKQAIAVLIGTANPDASIYEVEYYYAKGANLTGNSTIKFDAVSCPIGYIRVIPTRIILDPTTKEDSFILESSADWKLVSGNFGIATIGYTRGAAGRYDINITQNNIGDGYFIFENEITLEKAVLYVANVTGKPWVLDTATWNMLGFWYDNGIFNF